MARQPARMLERRKKSFPSLKNYVNTTPKNASCHCQKRQKNDSLHTVGDCRFWGTSLGWPHRPERAGAGLLADLAPPVLRRRGLPNSPCWQRTEQPCSQKSAPSANPPPIARRPHLRQRASTNSPTAPTAASASGRAKPFPPPTARATKRARVTTVGPLLLEFQKPPDRR